MEDSEKCFEAIRGFFTVESWEELSLYEKQRYCNVKTNYDKMKELGKFSVLTRFVLCSD